MWRLVGLGYAFLSFSCSLASAQTTLIRGDIIVVDTSVSVPQLLRIDPSDGSQTVITQDGLFNRPREVTVSSAGEIYVVDREAFGGGGGIIHVDAETGTQSEVSSGGIFVDPVGITIDHDGQLIVADRFAFDGQGAIVRVDPVTGNQDLVSAGGLGCSSSVTVGLPGQYFATNTGCASGSVGSVLQIDAVDGSFTTLATGGGLDVASGIVFDSTRDALFVASAKSLSASGAVFKVAVSTGTVSLVSSAGILDPIDLAQDSAGDLLVCDIVNGGTIFRIDPDSGSTAVLSNGGLLDFPIGIDVVRNLPPTVDAGEDQTVSCDASSSALVALNGSGTDPDGDQLSFHWDVPAGIVLDDPSLANANGLFPPGIWTATLTAVDGNGGVATDSVQITVVDSAPPEVGCIVSRAALWPPNHKMVEVDVRIDATDACDAPDDLILADVFVLSNEPDDTTGDGSSLGDVHGLDGFSTPAVLTNEFSYNAVSQSFEGTISLRAERSGYGDGRSYTITALVVDSSGNDASTSCVVVVPQSRKK